MFNCSFDPFPFENRRENFLFQLIYNNNNNNNRMERIKVEEMLYSAEMNSEMNSEKQVRTMGKCTKLIVRDNSEF